MSRTSYVVALLLTSSFLGACSSANEEERAPEVQGACCSPAVYPSVGEGASGGGSGTGGSGAGGATATAEWAVVKGTTTILGGLDFTSELDSFARGGWVHYFSIEGEQRMETMAAGTDTFQFANLKGTEKTWFVLAPDPLSESRPDTISDAMMPVFQTVDLTKSSDIELVTVPEGAVKLAFSPNLSGNLDLAAGAWVLLDVVDGEGLPVSGVAWSTPEEVKTSYENDLKTFEPSLSSTTALGRLIAGPIRAAELPGGEFREIVVAKGEKTWSVSVRLAAGTLTIATIVVDEAP